MHVLTKLFIVLVSLLSALLVPLVVVYAYNENSYQARFVEAETKAASARAATDTQALTHGKEIMRRDNEIQSLQSFSIELQRLSDRQETEIRRLEAQVVESESLDADIRAQLSTLASSVDAGGKLTGSLIEELRGLRHEALTSERVRVELDEAHRDALAQLDAAVQAWRALQEELQRVKDDHARTLEQLGEYVAQYGALRGHVATAAIAEVPIDHDVDATVISVRRNSERVLAEIDAGSRDGVKVGWRMVIGGRGFLANLRIIEVDISRATGVVELEDADTRGRVEPGDHCFARVRR